MVRGYTRKHGANARVTQEEKRHSMMKISSSLMSIVFAVGLAAPLRSEEDAASPEPEGEITLQRVLDLTLSNSFKISLAQEQFEAAQRALRSAKRRGLPRVSAQGWFSGDLFEVSNWDSNNLAGYLALDWDFYQDGAIMQAIAQAWANLASAALTRRQTALDLIYNSTSFFFDALKAIRQVEVAEQQVQVDEMQLQIIQSEYDQGRRTRAELGDAEAKAFEMRLALTRAEQDLRNSILKLQQLTRDDTIRTVSQIRREIAWQLDFPVEDAIATALTNEPNVLIAEANLTMAKLGIKYAKLKRWPSVRFLTGSDYAFAPFREPQEFGFRVGVIVSYPLYDAGDRKSRIEDAESAARRAHIQVWQAQDQMKQDVTDSYAGVANQLELLRIADKRHEKVKTDFARAQDDFKQQKIGKLDMERIRLQYLQSEQRIESLRLDALLARAKLLKGVGVSSLDDIRAYSQKRAEEKK